MKKNIYLFAFICATALKAFSQSYYIKPFYKNSFQAFPDYYTTIDENIIWSVDTTVYINDYNYNSFSLGEGKSYGISAGRTFNNEIEGIEGSLSWFMGNRQKLSSRFVFEVSPMSSLRYTETWSEYYYTNSLDLHLLYFRKFTFGKISPFFRTGVIVSYLIPYMNAELYVINTMSGPYPGKHTYLMDYKINNDFIAGGYGSAGFELFPESVFSVGFEIFLSMRKYKPEKMICTKYTIDDEDMMDIIPPAYQEIYFTESYSSLENENENRPGQLTKKSFSMSGWGIKVGLSYNF